MRSLPVFFVTACWMLSGSVLAGSAYAQAIPAFPTNEPRLEENPFKPLRLDVRQADALIIDVFSSHDSTRYSDAVAAYLSLLARLDSSTSVADQPIFLKHLGQSAMILPKQMRAALEIDEALAHDNLSALSEGAGAALVRWWLRQDDLPATPAHERLEEHLTRVAYALTSFPSENDDRGFDDRGEIYVRLGAPWRATSIELDFKGTRKPHIPDNRFWVFPQIDDDAYYLFIRQDNKRGYRLADATTLIPPDLRAGIGSGNHRSDSQTSKLLAVMEEVYAQLALYYPAFGAIHDEVTNFNTLPNPQYGRPDRAVMDMLLHAKDEDLAAEWRRTNEVPVAHSDVRGLLEDLPASIRWARFLDPDGTTRTEIYWGLDAHLLAPSQKLTKLYKTQGHRPSEQYLLSLSVLQRRADYERRTIHTKHYLLPAAAEGIIQARPFVVRGDTGTYHLALQWDERWTRADESGSENIHPGAQLKLGTYHIDSLQALQGNQEGLEMSDLKPSLYTAESADDHAAYPFHDLKPEAPLALYFELYHLRFGEDDKTRYTIEYEVVQRREAGGVLSFLKRSPEERTATRTSHIGTSTVAQEYVVLDLSDRHRKGTLEISVHATDEVSGEQVTRSIAFELQP